MISSVSGLRQRIDNKVLIDGIVVGTGGAVQAAADARQDVTQKREGFGTIAGDSAKRYPFLRGGDRLAAVMLANFQFIIFRRETVILIAVGQLAGEGREVILAAVTAIGWYQANTLRTGWIGRSGSRRVTQCRR